MKSFPNKEKASRTELATTATTLEGRASLDGFLAKIDRLGGDISQGKWKKLYAVCAEASRMFRRNIRIYQSSNGWCYDTTEHRAYQESKVRKEHAVTFKELFDDASTRESKRGIHVISTDRFYYPPFAQRHTIHS